MLGSLGVGIYQAKPSCGISFRSTGERHIPGRPSPELVWFQVYVPSLHTSGNSPNEAVFRQKAFFPFAAPLIFACVLA